MQNDFTARHVSRGNADANAVLAVDGTSITRLIRARRLERCRRALEDPSQAHRRVSEIAYGWGFSDRTHFGRSFRAAFGSLPREYRRLAKIRLENAAARLINSQYPI
jgi:AraC family transcriptional activator of tynA and feaB